SLDQIGIISKIGADCAYLSSFLFGKDKKDWSVLNLPVPKYNLYTTCLSTEAVILRRHAPCRNLNWTYSLSLFPRIGIKIIEEEKLKYIDLLLPCYCVLSSVECYSNFSRYDGIRYGLKLKESDTFRLYKKLRSIGYGLNIRQKLMTGAYILSSRSNYTRFYKRAENIRFVIKSNLLSLITGKLGLIIPTTP
ncbi:MAG: hypothetical protein ACKESC_00510, partial [Candidatus Hodgkinia cicadicola]